MDTMFSLYVITKNRLEVTNQFVVYLLLTLSLEFGWSHSLLHDYPRIIPILNKNVYLERFFQNKQL